MKKKFQLILEHVLLALTSVGQILAVALTYRVPVSSSLRNSGWILLWISALFGILPIFTFRSLGKVKKGSSYIHTNQLVDQGIYSIVRHPQYFSGILISLGLLLIAPGWLNLVLGLANIVQYYLGTFGEEKGLVARFGQKYIAYQKEVPRLNSVWEIVKKLLGR